MSEMNKDDGPVQSQMDRRDFLIRSAKAGLTVGVAAALGFFLHDPFGPGPPKNKPPAALPDFSVPRAGRKIAIATGSDRIKTVDAALKALGGMGNFIKRGDRVLIKVNAAFASPPSLGATTHPELVSEVARLCVRAGAGSVAVTDNPINDPQSCFSLSGIAEAAKSSGAELILPERSLFTEFSAPGSNLIRDWPVFTGAFKGVTKLIGIAPVKSHYRAGASMSMKNWYGFMGGRRNIFHQSIHTFIKDLAVMVKPTLVILDGTYAMVSNGPTGGSVSDLKETDTMIASTDQVAADSAGALLLGKTAKDLPYIIKAQQAGVGTSDFESLKPFRVSTG